MNTAKKKATGPGVPSVVVRRVVELWDGGDSLKDIARRTGLPAPRVAEVLRTAAPRAQQPGSDVY